MATSTSSSGNAPAGGGSNPGVTPEQAIADYALWLALTPFLWVHRRVETFELVDADTVHRHMSVDFTLPPGAGITTDQEVAVPVGVVAKHPLRDFDLRSDEGRSVALFTKQEGVIGRGLAKYIGLLQDPQVVALGPQQVASIDTIIKAGAKSGRDEAERALGDGGTLSGLFAPATDAKVTEDREDAEAFLKDLGDKFVVLACLPYRPGHRQVVKVSYDGPRVRPSSLPSKVYWWFEELFSSLGLIRRLEVLDGLKVGLATSYHAEFVPPADTYAAGMELCIYKDIGRHRAYGARVSDDERHRPHVNVDSREAREGAPLELVRGDHGQLELKLQARRESLVFPLLLSAAVITGTAWFVEKQAADGAKLDGATLAALLVVPFILAAYYVRSAENNYVTRMLRGLRIVAGIPVLAGVFIVAATGLDYLAKTSGKPNSEWAFDWAAHARYITLVPTCMLAVAWLSPWLGHQWRRFSGLRGTEVPFVYRIVLFLLRLVLILCVLIIIDLVLAMPVSLR